MPAPVIVNFQAAGIAELKNSILTVEKALGKLDSVNRRSSSSRRQQAKSDADEITKVEGRAGQARERLAEKEAKAKARIAEREVKTAEKAEREKSKAAEAAARDRERLNAKSFQNLQRWVDRESKLVEKGQRDQARVALAEANRTAAFRRNLAGVGFASARGMVGRGVSIAGGALALGGGFEIADALRTGMQDELTAVQISNSAYMPGDAKNGTRVDPKQIMKEAGALALKSGAKRGEILEGLKSFIATTGDLGAARDVAGGLADLSVATGTNFNDMMTSAAGMQMKGLSSSEILQTSRILAAQGKVGAIEISDLAAFMPRVAAPAAEVEGDRAQNIRKLSALAQMARGLGSAPDPAEATMAAERVVDDIGKHEGFFAGHGVRIKGQGGKIRDVTKIIEETVLATHGDITALHEGFGERSYKVATAFGTVYKDAVIAAEQKKGKPLTEAERRAVGQSAMDKQLTHFMGSEMSTQEVSDSHAAVMATNAKKLEQATEQFQQDVQQELGPSLTELIEDLRGALPYVREFLHFFAEHPWSSIFTLMGANITKDVAAAGIGAMVKNAIERALAGEVIAGGVPGAGGAAKAGGAGLLARGGVAAGLLAVALEEKATIETVLQGQQRGQLAAGALGQDVKMGTITPAQARAQVEKARGNSSGVAIAGTLFDPRFGFDALATAVQGKSVFGTQEKLGQQVADRQIANLGQALEKLTTTVSNASTALGKDPGRSQPMPARNPLHD